MVIEEDWNTFQWLVYFFNPFSSHLSPLILPQPSALASPLVLLTPHHNPALPSQKLPHTFRYWTQTLNHLTHFNYLHPASPPNLTTALQSNLTCPCNHCPPPQPHSLLIPSIPASLIIGPLLIRLALCLTLILLTPLLLPSSTPSIPLFSHSPPGHHSSLCPLDSLSPQIPSSCYTLFSLESTLTSIHKIAQDHQHPE